jgi:hypothetical protein
MCVYVCMCVCVCDCVCVCVRVFYIEGEACACVFGSVFQPADPPSPPQNAHAQRPDLPAPQVLNSRVAGHLTKGRKQQQQQEEAALLIAAMRQWVGGLTRGGRG